MFRFKTKEESVISACTILFERSTQQYTFTAIIYLHKHVSHASYSQSCAYVDYNAYIYISHQHAHMLSIMHSVGQQMIQRHARQRFSTTKEVY